MTIQKTSSSFSYRLLLFLVFPFIAFLSSVRRIHIKEHFWIVLLFTLFFCYTFIPYFAGSDADKYVERLGSLGEYGFSQYLDDIKGMYDGGGLYQDAYVYTIQFLVSSFTTDIRIYRLVFGFVYFYTFLSLLKYLLLNVSQKTKLFNWFIIGLVFIISFASGINGVRWPTALMVFLFGSYKYISTSKTKFIVIASLSAFIHFIFFFSVFFLLVFLFTRRFYNPKRTSVLVLMAFFLSAFFASGIKSSLSLVGQAVEERSLEYMENESWKERRIEGFQRLNWYVQLQRSVPNLFVLLALLITTYFGNSLKKSSNTVALQYFSLLCFLASFISGQLVVATDNRFAIVATASGFIYLFHLFNENSENKFLNILRVNYIPIAVLTVLVNMRADLYTVSPNLIFGNLITEAIYRYDQSIQQLLGL